MLFYPLFVTSITFIPAIINMNLVPPINKDGYFTLAFEPICIDGIFYRFTLSLIVSLHA
ncbi:protein of unknown function [Vibrio tapetis subsp. tapetis]|uniref:Uncharacterized protein n=1 Tax=Vibrio tapetis subsp. tapetis TaxID=1671868 RepID=A0A2N8ZBV3_9VIBR|nr:protein of unknown function [Vibrio tapetis subsp. tapetis]